MQLSRWVSRSAPLAAAALLSVAAGASAQARPLFAWNGRVDREVDLVMRGNDVATRLRGDNERRAGRARVASALPRQDGYVAVRLERGRGDVDVIQQPSERNGYTTVVRIRDDRAGADDYRLSTYWRPVNGRGDDRPGWGDGRGNGGWDRGRGNDRDDHRGGWDRDGRGRPGNGGGWDRGGRNVALHWSGRVDDDVEVRIRGSRVDYVTLHGNRTVEVRSDVGRFGLPARDVPVSVRQNRGRGNVYVAQQPSARNGYTAVIRIRDPESGYGYYDFDLTW